MIVISFATSCRCGSNSDISAPDSPQRLNSYGDPSSFGVPLIKAKRSPLVNSLGTFCPSYFCSMGFGSNRSTCLLYTSDAADDLLCVDLGGRRIIKKKKKK